MISMILAIFSSGGFGSIVGLIGGYFNRKLDLDFKKLEYEDKVKDREHDLLKMDKERDFMKAEYDMRLQVADKEIVKEQIEADKDIEVAGYGAMEKSYSYAATTSADGWVDKFSKAIRPFITLIFVIFSGIIFWQVTKIVLQMSTPVEAAYAVVIWQLCIEWVLFQCGVCVGWWFAMRPGKHPTSM